MRAEGNLRRPLDAPSEVGRNGQEALSAAGEDSDCAPSFEAQLPDTKKVGSASLSSDAGWHRAVFCELEQALRNCSCAACCPSPYP